MPETDIVSLSARQTQIANIEILDTPRESKMNQQTAGGGANMGWSVGHSGSPGVVNLGRGTGVWPTHTFDLEEDARGKELRLVIDECYSNHSFAVLRNIKVLGTLDNRNRSSVGGGEHRGYEYKQHDSRQHIRGDKWRGEGTYGGYGGGGGLSNRLANAARV